MRIVVKVGTSTLTHKTGNLNIRLVKKLCQVLSDIKNAGNEVLLVSSGAIGMGVGKLMMSEKPTDIPTKQAAAAVGQCELMFNYDRFFQRYNHTVAQVLLTGEDLAHKERSVNVKNTLCRLLELGALPIINENDTVATQEIAVGDNDTLSAIVATGVNADLLILLTDIDGVYTKDPRKDASAKLIENIDEITDEIINGAMGAGSKLGTGGMRTKLDAAKIATAAKIPTIITNGENPDALYDIIDGKKIGTYFSV